MIDKNWDFVLMIPKKAKQKEKTYKRKTDKGFDFLPKSVMNKKLEKIRRKDKEAIERLRRM